MKIFNRRARRDYKILETFEAGVALTGSEVKSVKQGRGDLTTAYVRIKDGEAWLIGANISAFGQVSPGYDPIRTRKLLLHKNQIVSLGTKADQARLTLVPLSLYTKGRLVKLGVALGQSKKRYEKKEEIKKRDIEKEVARELKQVSRG